MAISTKPGGSPGAGGAPENWAAAAILPDADRVKEQLCRILGSGEFQGSERTRRFLRFVVDEALAGRADRIKAFSVAVAAFDRDETFNPQTDPIVRIEAARLRRCLERYYLVAGSQDEVRIDIPKGSYVPDFLWNQDSQASGAPDREATLSAEAPAPSPRSRGIRLPLLSLVTSTAALAVALGLMVFNWAIEVGPKVVERAPQDARTSIAVLPFETAATPGAESAFAIGMTNEIVRELSQFSGLFVLGPKSLKRFGTHPDITTVGEEAGTAFVLSGDVEHAQDRIRVAVQLSESSTGSVVWAESFDRAYDVKAVFDLQAAIGREIVRKIAQPQGAISLFDWKRTRGMAPESWAAYDCVVQAEELQRRGSLAQKRAEIRPCLARTVSQSPGYADAWVMLALLEVDLLRYAQQTEISPEKLETAYAAAQRGVDLAPDSGRAHMALMLALFFQGEVERAMAVGDVALRLSPQDPDVVTEVGLRQVVGGDPDSGLRHLERAASLYNEAPAGLRLSMALGYLRKGLVREASLAIDEIVPNANFVYLAVATAV
jgi:adenylate cyclase